MAETVSEKKPEVAGVPEWDLSDLYVGKADPLLDRDLAGAGKLAHEFSGRYIDLAEFLE